jgi:hypothetical protein
MPLRAQSLRLSPAAALTAAAPVFALALAELPIAI